MEKKCFIIMPLGEPAGYPNGHFNRVYQYIIVPACRLAGFNPVRVNDPDLTSNPVDIINTMIESDSVLCDLSSNDPHALYGFAIRQATNLPVTLIKDLKTNVFANIPEFEVVEYDESLRIDTVQNEIEMLGEALKKSFVEKTEPIQLLSRLNIPAAQTSVVEELVSTPEPVTENTVKQESHLPLISPLPDFVGDPLTQSEIDRLKIGDSFFHRNYGRGEILTINHKTKDILAKVQFDSGSKLLVLVPSDIFRKVN